MMVEHTKISNTNLEDITKGLEDMDSLDIELFNDSFKKTKSINVIKDSNKQSDAEIKKKVIFKDPNEDDLLAGLLSDEETSVKEKNFFASSSKSSLMEDLFKIKTPVISVTSISSSNELGHHFVQKETNQLFSQKLNGYSASKNNFTVPQSESPKENNRQKLRNVSKNEENILINLSNVSDGDKAKRSSLKENLFENQPHSSNFISKNIKKTESETMIQESKLDPIDLSTSKFLTKEFRRGRRNTKIINNPLGLLPTDVLSDQSLELATNENMSTKNAVIQNTKTEKDLPEWLGGSKKIEDAKSEMQNEEVTKIGKVITSSQNGIHNTNIAVDSKTPGANDSEGTSTVSKHFKLLFDTQQLNQQNALINMEQQEHELRTAAILSQQNEQLHKISNSQHSMLCNQEEQFNALLKLQFEKQVLLERQIKMQQERINQYIHVLMTQSMPISSSTTIQTCCKTDLDEERKEFTSEITETKNVIKKLEGKKSKLENKLSIIKEKHDNELTFQAEFYERQMKFLKEVIIKSEKRVKQEIEYLETDYTTKLEKLRNEKLQMENQYKEEIHNLKDEHAQRIQELCKLHDENIKLLQKEYCNIIENISKAKQMEHQLIQTMTTRKTDIEDILQKASVIIEGMAENKKVLEINHNEIMRLQENTLKIQEDNIKTQTLELKYQNSSFEEYRNKFIQTTEKLDIRLTQLIIELQKQCTLCTQTEETLEKRTMSLLRERELFEEKIKWERDYMQALKESWIKEQEKQLKLLAGEKEVIAMEKAQLEVLNKLKNNNGEIVKIELEAAVKTAQVATESANRERLIWQEKINELNTQKQVLQDNENSLILRAKELEYLTQSALTKREEGIKALKDAKHLENQNKEKFNQLQIQIEALMEREKKIAIEKYNITKGRMNLSVYENEKPEKDINLSHNFQNDIIPFSEMQSKSEIPTDFMNIIDPNLIMLKFNFNDELNSISKYM